MGAGNGPEAGSAEWEDLVADDFAAYDRDGNGFICAAELGLELVREADADGDGQISYEEFFDINFREGSRIPG